MKIKYFFKSFKCFCLSIHFFFTCTYCFFQWNYLSKVGSFVWTDCPTICFLFFKSCLTLLPFLTSRTIAKPFELWNAENEAYYCFPNYLTTRKNLWPFFNLFSTLFLLGGRTISSKFESLKWGIRPFQFPPKVIMSRIPIHIMVYK